MVRQRNALLRYYHKLRSGRPWHLLHEWHGKFVLDHGSERRSRLKNENGRRYERRPIR